MLKQILLSLATSICGPRAMVQHALHYHRLQEAAAQGVLLISQAKRAADLAYNLAQFGPPAISAEAAAALIAGASQSVPALRIVLQQAS